MRQRHVACFTNCETNVKQNETRNGQFAVNIRVNNVVNNVVNDLVNMKVNVVREVPYDRRTLAVSCTNDVSVGPLPEKMVVSYNDSEA